MSRQELKLNQLYLVRQDNKLRRASLLAMSGKRVLQFHLIDSGDRLELTNDSPIYILMPKYFRYPVFAVHCRLGFADTLERTLIKEEKQKVMRQVTMAQRVRIVDAHRGLDGEPYMIELLDEAGNVDFTLSQSVSRFSIKGYFEIESQEIVKGSQVISAHNENTYN